MNEYNTSAPEVKIPTWRVARIVRVPAPHGRGLPVRLERAGEEEQQQGNAQTQQAKE